MKKFVSSTAGCLLAVQSLLVPPLAIAAVKETRLAPSEAWNMHYADDGCQLARMFGTGKDRVYLILERYEPSDVLRVSVAGAPLKPAETRSAVKIAFGPGQTPSVMEVRIGNLGEFAPALFGSAYLTGDDSEAGRQRKAAKDAKLPPPQVSMQEMVRREIALARTVDWIALDVSGSKRLILDTGGLERPLSAMRACTADLVKTWGLDPTRQASLSSRPVPRANPGSWVKSTDYPRAMAQQGMQSLIQFRLMVDAIGNVSSCHIQRSTRLKEFDDTTCKVFMKRAKFEPARDASGQPVASYWNSTITYVME